MWLYLQEYIHHYRKWKKIGNIYIFAGSCFLFPRKAFLHTDCFKLQFRRERIPKLHYNVCGLFLETDQAVHNQPSDWQSCGILLTQNEDWNGKCVTYILLNFSSLKNEIYYTNVKFYIPNVHKRCNSKTSLKYLSL